MKMNLKRLLTLAMCLCMLCACAMAEGGNKTLYYEPGDYETMTGAEWDAREAFGTPVAVGDTVYLMAKTALWSWRAGESELTKLPYKVANLYALTGEEISEDTVLLNGLVTDGKCLYGYNGQRMYDENPEIDLYLLLDESGAFVGKTVSTLKLNMSDEDGYYPDGGMTITDGKVYLTHVSYGDSGWSEYGIISFDLATGGSGTPVNCESKYLTAVTPYKDGKLLARIFDEEHAYNPQTQTMTYPTCAVLDPATGKLETLFESINYSAGSFTYLPQQDAIAYIEDSCVHLWKQGDTQSVVAAYLPDHYYADTTGAMSIVGGNMLLWCYNDAVICRELDPSISDSVALTIYGGWSDTPHTKFALNHPDINIANASNYYENVEDLTQAMVSGSGVDVMMMDTNYSAIKQLIDKGYALCLNDYPEIMQGVNGMYPALLEPFTRDGKLYAVPVYAWGDSYSYNAEVMEKLGLTRDDLPTSMYGLLDMLENWEYDYGDEFEDIVPFSDTNVKNQLMYRIMSMYVSYQMQQGQAISFDTPLFRKLMEKLESIDFTTIDHEYDENDEAGNEEWWMKESLFYNGGDTLTPRYYGDTLPLILSLDEGMEPVVDVNINAMFINPKSPCIDQAVMYVAEYLQNLDEYSVKVSFFQDRNDPVPNPRYEEYLKDWKETLAGMEKEYETADPEVKKDLEMSIEYYKKMIDDPSEYQYIISSEKLTFYREKVAPFMFVPGKTVLNTYDKDGNSEFYTQLQMYQDGALTLDQFIKEVDKRLRMMQLEDM